MAWRILLSVILYMWLAQSRAADITAIPLDRPGQGAIVIEGDIALDDREAFLTKIAPFSGGMVVFNSKGGSAFAGIDIGKAIRMRNFTTWVPSGSFCASACAMAWLGGTRRLMGKAALIGFHSVYQMNNGAPVETGAGNAIYGAYLSQLGLSDRAIMYLSGAAPTSMNWLTPADAENLGIKLTVFDPDPKVSGSSPAAKPLASLETRARDFVIALNVLVSGPSEKLISVLGGIYSDQVLYYGKQLSRGEIIAQISKFTNRWPTRVYTVRPSSMEIRCDEQNLKCHVDGLVDFDAKSLTRNQRSHGLATFEYLLAFDGNSRWPVIVTENGKVVNRQIDALQEETAGPPVDLNVR